MIANTSTRKGIRRASAVGVAALVAASGLLAAPAAHAADTSYQPGVGNSQGAGFNSAQGTSYDWSDSQDFIGSFTGSDGTTAYCIDGVADYPWTDAGTAYGKPYKVDNFVNEAGQEIGTDKTDEIAWLLNEHGATSDADTAAAVQLLVWNTVDGSLPGGSGYTDWMLTEDAGVAAAYDSLQAEIASEAYRSSDIEAVMTTNGDGTGTVSFNATIDFINGGEQQAPVGEFSGEAVLQNAEFADGSQIATVENGVEYPITFAGTTAATAEASVNASFDGLVADYYMMIADPVIKTNPESGEPYQRVILADMVPKTVETASEGFEVVLPNPAEVVVQTQTSDFVVDENDLPVSLTDTVSVSVLQTGLNQNAEWPVDPNGELVPVDIELSLYKAPNDVPFEQSATIPEGAELIGTDMIEGVTAVGDYVTPAGVQITEPGRYVFVERVLEVVLDYGQGETTKVPECQGDYGISKESTYVPYRPSISTEVLTKTPTVGETVADSLTVTKFAPDAGTVEVEVHAVGPFVAGAELPELTRENLADYTVETQAVTIDADGEYVTPNFVNATVIETDEETGEVADTYYFVLTSEGNAPEEAAAEANPASFIPAFEDLGYHESETYTVIPVPTPEPSKPIEPTTPTTPEEPGLAQTGADGWWMGVAALSAGLVLAGGVLVALQRRRVAAGE